MECPVCQHRLQLKVIEGIKIDVCETDGVWLDKNELEELMKTAQKRGEDEGLLKGIYKASKAY